MATSGMLNELSLPEGSHYRSSQADASIAVTSSSTVGV